VKNCKIILSAEKAQISIEQSVNNFIEVELKLIAKHTNEEIARRESQYLKYNLIKKGNTYYINNNILLPKKTKSTESRLSAIYILKIPQGCELDITNTLGNTFLTGLDNDVNIRISYGNLNVDKCTGKLDVKTKIGDIQINNSLLNARLLTEYSEINMEGVNGAFNMESRFGSINLEPGYKMEQLNIEALKTNVYIFNTNEIEYTLNISTEHGSIKTNESLYIKSQNLLTETKNKGQTIRLEYPLKVSSGVISISSRFSNINLR
jgi:hypothetical protein